MMKTEKNRRILKQGFIPIMVDDDYDTKMLIESVARAGCKVIEYTCRRKDARKFIPWIKKEYPDMLVLGASLIDGKNAEKFLSGEKDNFITVDEMVELGADGLVSFMKFSEATYKKYGKDKIMIPGVETYNDAIEQIEFGADFIKIFGNNPMGPGFIKAGQAATHGLFSFFVTGGMRDEKIDAYIKEGAVLCAGGFDLICSEKVHGTISIESLSAAMMEKCRAVHNAREKYQQQVLVY